MDYIIKPGDTLYQISRRYRTTVQDLLSLNPTIEPDNLRVGQVICVPRKKIKIPCPGGSYYAIKQGDTLFLTAQKYNLSVDELLAANPGINPENLMVGQIICIPPKDTICPNGEIYTVQENDTFLQIAIKFDISYNALKRANPYVDVTDLEEGQTICIPPFESADFCPDEKVYIIEEGDTLTSIAEEFVISATDLLIVNPNMAPSDFVTGRLICLPPEAPV